MRSLNDIIEAGHEGHEGHDGGGTQRVPHADLRLRRVRSITILMQDQNGQWGKMEKAVGRAGAAQQVANAKMKGLNGAMEGFKSTIETLAISFGTTLLPPLTKAFQALSGLAPILQQNKTAVMVVVGALGALAAGTWAVNLAMAANPYVVAAVALAGLVIGIVKAYQASETFRGVVLAVFNAIQTAFTATVGAIVGRDAGGRERGQASGTRCSRASSACSI
jgi:phage-related protein